MGEDYERNAIQQGFCTRVLGLRDKETKQLEYIYMGKREEITKLI